MRLVKGRREMMQCTEVAIATNWKKLGARKLYRKMTCVKKVFALWWMKWRQMCAVNTSTNFTASAFVIPLYGRAPRSPASHITTPKLHTSDCVVYCAARNASGALHCTAQRGDETCGCWNSRGVIRKWKQVLDCECVEKRIKKVMKDETRWWVVIFLFVRFFFNRVNPSTHPVREHSAAWRVRAFVAESAEAEVGDLHGVSAELSALHEKVARGEVAVDDVVWGQVLHPSTRADEDVENVLWMMGGWRGEEWREREKRMWMINDKW